MRFIILTIISISLTPIVYGIEWNYIGPNNPKEWAKLFPGCAGSRQSPINIDMKNVIYDRVLKPFTVISKKSGNLPNFTLINEGHKVEVKFPVNTWELTFQSEAVSYCFMPLQMHWHWGADNAKGSEHLLNGKGYPLELHIVTYNCRLFTESAKAASGVNGLAVLGVWYEIDDKAPPDPLLTAITSEFSKPEFRQCGCRTKHDEAKVSIAGFNLMKALPDNVKDFYRYMGSLTTPPCTENVLWTIYTTPKKITTKQMKAFRSLLYPASLGANRPMVDNYRPAQQVNPSTPVSTYRSVTASFGSAPNAAPSLFTLFLLCVLSITKLNS